MSSRHPVRPAARLGSGRLRELRGLRAHRRGRPAEAAAALEEALAAGIRSARLFRALTASYAACGRWRRARRTAQQGVDAHPRDAHLRLHLGHALRHKGSIAAAAVQYATALALDPGLACTEATSTIARVSRSSSPFEAVLFAPEEPTGSAPLLLEPGGPPDRFSRRLGRLASEHRELTDAYRRSLRAAAAHARTRYLTRRRDADLERFRTIADTAGVGDLSELMLRFATAHGVDVPPSFHACIHLRSRQHQLVAAEGHDLPEWILNAKAPGNEFGDLLGLVRPWRSQDAVPLADVAPRPGTVLKPIGGGGARGVFAYEDDGTILEIGTGRTLASVDEALVRARQLLDAGTIPSDAWVLEEIVRGEGRGGLARDLKFYTYYGRVGLALEVDRFPAPRHCWWTRERDVADVGKYRGTSFVGRGPSADDVALAEWVSAQIPAPFIRIDFLVGAAGPLFGEFTARPGGLHQFSREADRRLGDEFLRAQARLEADLAAQRTFETFARVRPPIFPSVFATTTGS